MKAWFHGNILQLMTIVQAAGAVGLWRELLDGHYQFRGDDGAVLNWWETTKTVTFQGPAVSARRLRAAIVEQLATDYEAADDVVDHHEEAPLRLLPFSSSMD